MERIITYSLQEDFIGNLADFIEENFIQQGEDISKLAFVFPGKRPALFLKKELSCRIKKGFFSPAFFSVDEFMGYVLSKKELYSRISDLDACYIIYKLAGEIAPDILKERSSFSKFLPWAREIFNFIEQLDLEDKTVESLKNIQEKASIGYDVPENINTLLASIISIRDAYQTTSKEKKVYSRGQEYLFASRYIKDIDFAEFSQILFCGFFYLHKTEENIIKNLYTKGKAMFFFQGGAGQWSVLEKVSQALASSIEPGVARKPNYNLSIQSGFDVHSEVGLVREIIKKTKELDNTVIVLPEPGNVIPLLSEISSCTNTFNVSIGYPLKRSSLYSLFECLFKAQATKKNDEYYAKDYLGALTHPLVKNLRLFSNPSLTRVLVHKIEEILLGIEETEISGSLFFKLSQIQGSRELYDLALMTIKSMDIQATYSQLKEALSELHNLLFLSWENVENFYDFSFGLERLLDILVEKSFLKNYPLNLKVAEKIFAIKEELKIASFNKEPFLKEEIFKIFENKLDNEMISFSGSPLRGLQILGLFETRSLNFENVIVMDANESALPNLKIYEPLIPREVMISLGLGRLEKEEEIQRYHFRRLISAAKNVHLIYQERDDKEKSRFIEELIWERQKEKSSFDVLTIARGTFAVGVQPKRLEISKNPQVLKFLKNREYSASSINTYLHCPLRFYYQYVLGLKEKEDSLGEAQSRDIGTFIHELLHEAFAKFIGKKPCLNGKFKKEFFAALDKKFKDEFEKKMKSDAFLIKEILDFRLKRFLENERQRNVRKILCLEKTFKTSIKFKEGDFRFKAVIDRIDRLDDQTILVLDYKTGGIDILPQVDIERIESTGLARENIKNTIRSFQLPLYLYFVINDKNYQGGEVNACLYSLREIDARTQGLAMLFKNDAQLANKEKIMRVYLGALGAILEDILNPGIPFKADEEDARQCANCPFFYMCR